MWLTDEKIWFVRIKGKRVYFAQRKKPVMLRGFWFMAVQPVYNRFGIWWRTADKTISLLDMNAHGGFKKLGDHNQTD